MNYDQLSAAIAAYVRSYLESHPDNRFLYHNLAHTEAVVAAAKQIGNHYQLNEKDFFIVTTAAWFHDIGYLIQPECHEVEGAEAGAAFLRQQGVSAEIIAAVKACIEATRIPQSPANLLEEIVCDADLFHLGQDSFKGINKRMHAEKELLMNCSFTKNRWRLGTIEFLENHHYHTDYCRMLLGDKKKAHLEALKKKAMAVAGQHPEAFKEHIDFPAADHCAAGSEQWAHPPAVPDDRTVQLPVTADKQPVAATERKPETEDGGKGKNDKKTKKGKKEGNGEGRPDKGIETMFRVTASNNQRLSNMADNKAHIMISVNSIILSAVISLLLRKLDNNASLAIPTYLLITVSMLTIIFSILATRPTIPKGTFTEHAFFR
jgi:predicted metal-dependent HD superfamily phosphohydrolase